MKQEVDEVKSMRRSAAIVAVLFSLIGGGLAVTGWGFFIPPLAIFGGLGAGLILIRSTMRGWRRYFADLAFAVVVPALITGACAIGLRAERYFFANRRVEPLALMLESRLKHDGKLPAKISEIPEIQTYCAKNRVIFSYSDRRELRADDYDGVDLIVRWDEKNFDLIVPVTHRSPMGFTRSYFYYRTGDSPGWTLTHTVWMLLAIP